MDFTEIDRVTGDSVTVGDIVVNAGGYHQIRRFEEESMTDIVFGTYNLSTGDEDELTIDPNASYQIFQVQ